MSSLLGLPLARCSVLTVLTALTLWTTGCASDKSNREPETGLPPLPVEGEVKRDLPDATGALLSEIDGLLRIWSSRKLGLSSDDRRQQRAVEDELRRMTTQRFDELLEQVEFGPPRNRQIAVMAIGFSDNPRALSPLLVSLDDSDLKVVDNALLGLGLLADRDTPLEPLTRSLLQGANGHTRNNAAYALLRVLQVMQLAGVDLEPCKDALRSALHDDEPGVRVQAATCLRLLSDGLAIEGLGDRLYDTEALVISASARAIGEIGSKVAEVRGQAARLLFEAWTRKSDNLRALMKLEMLRLSEGLDYGEVEKDWREWAYRLP